jgi:hypothetical protein
VAKLELDFVDDSDTRWAHIIFRQEGMRGFTLPLSWLPEFLHGLESRNNEAFCIYKNYLVHSTRSSCKLFVSTIADPLLHLDEGQRMKLIAHLKEHYKSWI